MNTNIKNRMLPETPGTAAVPVAPADVPPSAPIQPPYRTLRGEPRCPDCGAIVSRCRCAESEE